MSGLVMLVVIAIIGIAAFSGYKRGFVHIAFTLAATVVAILLSSALSQPVGRMLKEKTPLYDNINKQVNEYIGKYIGDEFDMKTTELSDDILKKIPIPASISSMLKDNNNTEVIKKLGAKNLGEYISGELTMIIINAIAYIAIFIIVTIILRILIGVLDVIARVPVIKELNRSLGLVIGIFEGMLIVWLLCLVVTGLGGTAAGQDIMKQVSGSDALSFIYKSNPLLKMFSTLTK